MSTHVNGVLLLYWHSLFADAATIMEHVNAFKQYSRFKVWTVNVGLGFPRGLGDLRFQAIVLHYSPFGGWPFLLNQQFLDYLNCSESSYKLALFQDEYRFCQARFALINDQKIDCVYTLVEPDYFRDTYLKYTQVSKLVYCIPGYVCDNLVRASEALSLADPDRCVDVGYRGRDLSKLFYMGRGAREKTDIALGFRQRASEQGLVLDIETSEDKRLYGLAWHSFLANCRAVLGVEAGVSIFDIEDVVYRGWKRLVAANPTIAFDEVFDKLLYQWEGNIPYRTISPRHFEAAAFRSCQILFEGKYSGMMQPMVHYIPLKKDFSNFDEVIRLFSDRSLRRELTANAYRDLIASGEFHYQRFIEGIDQVFLEAGLRPGITDAEERKVTEVLDRDAPIRRTYAMLKSLPARSAFGRWLLESLYRPAKQAWQQRKTKNAINY